MSTHALEGGAETNEMQALAQQIVALRSENVALQEQSALKSTRSENVALQEQLTSTRGAAPAAGSDAGAKRAAGGTHTGGNAAKRARNEVEVDCSTQGMSLQAGMAGLFRDRLLCDVTVIVGGSEFKAHACVLAAVSGYFRRLLVGASPIKKAATRISLNFEHVTAATFAAVLDCIYMGKMVVEEDSIVAVVHISNKLELLAVRSACIGHLVSRVQDSNMEQMLALGQELACTELVDAAKAAIRKRSGYGSPNGEDKRQGKSRGRKVYT